MKTVDAGQFAANMTQYLQDSLVETIVLTQAGKPCAVVHGVNYDEEQVQLVNSREFWAMVRERRQQPTIAWDVAKERLRKLDEGSPH